MSIFVHMICVLIFVVSVIVCIVLLMILFLRFFILMMENRATLWNLLVRIPIKKLKFLFSMCTHGRFVTNKYTRTQFWSKCGKCKSCLQEKAVARSNRIRNEYDGETPVYFVTLTYDRMSVPYFTQEDFNSIYRKGSGIRKGFLPIRRKCVLKWDINKRKYVRSYKGDVISQVPVDLDIFKSSELRFMWLKKSHRDIGVCYFKDLQDFVKRLRINLKRSGYENKLRIFDCSEYGGKFQRPHFHLLISAKDIQSEVFHDFVVKSWPYGRRIRAQESCQLVTEDPAGYVASYVNSGEKLSPFLTCYFKSKHSASKFFGHGLRAFSLEEVKKKIDTGTLDYSVSRIKDGVPQVFNFPLPKYVINRFFPLFKGYSRFDGNEILEFLSRGFDVSYLAQRARLFDLNNPYKKIDYNDVRYVDVLKDGKLKRVKIPAELDSILIRFQHAFDYYRKVFPGSSPFDYAKDYYNAWKCYRSTVFKFWRLDDRETEFEKFDNMCQRSIAFQLDYFERFHKVGEVFCVDNNSKHYTVDMSLRMEQLYDKYCKQKEVSNFVLNEQGILI